jgi:hypothetical protein
MSGGQVVFPSLFDEYQMISPQEVIEKQFRLASQS